MGWEGHHTHSTYPTHPTKLLLPLILLIPLSLFTILIQFIQLIPFDGSSHSAACPTHPAHPTHPTHLACSIHPAQPTHPTQWLIPFNGLSHSFHLSHSCCISHLLIPLIPFVPLIPLPVKILQPRAEVYPNTLTPCHPLSLSPGDAADPLWGLCWDTARAQSQDSQSLHHSHIPVIAINSLSLFCGVPSVLLPAVHTIQSLPQFGWGLLQIHLYSADVGVFG